MKNIFVVIQQILKHYKANTFLLYFAFIGIVCHMELSDFADVFSNSLSLLLFYRAMIWFRGRTKLALGLPSTGAFRLPGWGPRDEEIRDMT